MGILRSLKTILKQRIVHKKNSFVKPHLLFFSTFVFQLITFYQKSKKITPVYAILRPFPSIWVEPWLKVKPYIDRVLSRIFSLKEVVSRRAVIFWELIFWKLLSFSNWEIFNSDLGILRSLKTILKQRIAHKKKLFCQTTPITLFTIQFHFRFRTYDFLSKRKWHPCTPISTPVLHLFELSRDWKLSHI